MNRFFLLIEMFFLFSVSNIQCSAQKKVLFGNYTNNVGTTLELSSTRIVILSRERDGCVTSSGRITDTIAVCNWGLVSENFIRIDSESPYERVQKSYISHKNFNPKLNRDSIRISFMFPAEKMPIEIELYDLKTVGKRFNKSLRYSKYNNELNSCDSVLVCIKPLYRPLNIEIFEGALEPRLLPPEFSFPFLLIATNGEQWNTIDIRIPCLTDSFFEQAWIVGEYIQVTEEGLLWRGDLFSPRKGYANGFPGYSGDERAAQSQRFVLLSYNHLKHPRITDFGARQYSPALRRWLVPDPLSEKYYDVSPYVYCHDNPVNLVDKDGRDGVLIVFPDYEIHVGSKAYKNLGHAGVLLINNKTGYTRYYEYGRYDSENKGIVRNIRVNNVTINENGEPTKESLEKVFKEISDNSGQGGRIEGAYIKSDEFELMRDYAEQRLKSNKDPQRKGYSLVTNNCATFASEVLSQDKKVKEQSPLFKSPIPTHVIKQYIKKFSRVTYDNKDEQL